MALHQATRTFVCPCQSFLDSSDQHLRTGLLRDLACNCALYMEGHQEPPATPSQVQTPELFLQRTPRSSRSWLGLSVRQARCGDRSAGRVRFAETKIMQTRMRRYRCVTIVTIAIGFMPTDPRHCPQISLQISFKRNRLSLRSRSVGTEIPTHMASCLGNAFAAYFLHIRRFCHFRGGSASEYLYHTHNLLYNSGRSEVIHLIQHEDVTSLQGLGISWAVVVSSPKSILTEV